MTTDSKEWYEWLFKNDKRTHKFKADEELLQYYCAELMKAHARWLYISEHGCSDPFWSDGTNMNLVRNHTIYYRKNIMALCRMRNFVVPSCYYEPSPPEVDSGFMANVNPTDEHQIKRLERIQGHEKKLTNEKPEFITYPQLSFVM